MYLVCFLIELLCLLDCLLLCLLYFLKCPIFCNDLLLIFCSYFLVIFSAGVMKISQIIFTSMVCLLKRKLYFCHHRFNQNISRILSILCSNQQCISSIYSLFSEISNNPLQSFSGSRSKTYFSFYCLFSNSIFMFREVYVL